MIRVVLVHLDHSPEAETRLDLAVAYARKHEAKLKAVYPVTRSHYQSSDIGEGSDADRVEAMFRKKSKVAGIAWEWCLVDASVSGVEATEIMTAHGYYADLIVVGQTNAFSPCRNVPANLPERLVLSAGRPVLVVPYAGKFETAGERMMVAWRPGREAVRSVNDALPLLKKARYVSVVQVTPEADPEKDPHLVRIREHLGRHRVMANIDQIPQGELSVGDVLLNLSCEYSIDLLAVGAYASTQRGTLALSPVARHLLQHLSVPVLMSH